MKTADFRSLLGLTGDALIARLGQMPEFDDCEGDAKVEALIFLLPYSQLMEFLEQHPAIEVVDDEDEDSDDDHDTGKACRACGESLDDEGSCPNDCTDADDYGVLAGVEDGYDWEGGDW